MLVHFLGFLCGCMCTMLTRYILGTNYEETIWFYLKCIMIGFSMNALIHPWSDQIVYILTYAIGEPLLDNNPWFNCEYNTKFVIFFHMMLFMSIYSFEIYESILLVYTYIK